MRKMITIAATMLAIFVLASPAVMAGNGKGTGDGNFFMNFFQWLRDDDGDGVPNCLDPDYVRPEDGSGYGKLGQALLSGAQSGDKDQIRDRDRLRERLHDGTCDGSGDGSMYRLSYKWIRSRG
jgi:hypothetical protein